MKPLFIPLELDKFQICCVPDCEYDAVMQLNAGQYYFTACGEPEHQIQIQKAGKMILEGVSLHLLVKQKELKISDVFICPEGYVEKCKLVQWEEFQKNPPEEVFPKPETKKKITPQDKTAPESWEWIANVHKWMDTEGNIVAIKSLSSDEFAGAALAILKANFGRISRKRQWVNTLVQPTHNYVYPAEALMVGSDIAGDKLDEFLEVAEERGLI
jgi:hypothetical protein